MWTYSWSALESGICELALSALWDRSSIYFSYIFHSMKYFKSIPEMPHAYIFIFSVYDFYCCFSTLKYDYDTIALGKLTTVVLQNCL